MKTNMQKYPNYKDSGVEWLGEIPNHWEVKKVTHVFNKIGSGTTPTAGALKYSDNGQINWLQTGDLNDGLIVDTNKKITKKAITDLIQHDKIEIIKYIGHEPESNFIRPLFDYEGIICIEKNYLI